MFASRAEPAEVRATRGGNRYRLSDPAAALPETSLAPPERTRKLRGAPRRMRCDATTALLPTTSGYRWCGRRMHRVPCAMRSSKSCLSVQLRHPLRHRVGVLRRPLLGAETAGRFTERLGAYYRRWFCRDPGSPSFRPTREMALASYPHQHLTGRAVCERPTRPPQNPDGYCVRTETTSSPRLRARARSPSGRARTAEAPGRRRPAA
jgi:hypothetical protein